MINTKVANQILRLTRKYWDDAVSQGEFESLARGKEIGHRIADFVDERTTELLKERFETKVELNKKGLPRARSMGDVWLNDQGIYHPINVKAGEAGKNGQPNMVSMNKLLEALLRHEIDSYYLLIVKMHMPGVAPAETTKDKDLDLQRIVPDVYFIDMLEYLDPQFLAFDAGPGQIMLKEKAFYEAFANGEVLPTRSSEEKVSHLADLMEDGHRRLIANRKVKLASLRRMVQGYGADGLSAINQEKLKLG